MAYGYSSYNTAGVPHLTSFAQAKHRYEQTKPIKGSANVRPLGVRRYHKMASISMPDADTVNLEFCGKPLVQWRSDNTYTVYRPVYASAYVPDNTSHYVPKRGVRLEAWRDMRGAGQHQAVSQSVLLPRWRQAGVSSGGQPSPVTQQACGLRYPHE